MNGIEGVLLNMEDNNSTSGWTKYEKLILSELARHDNSQELLQNQIMNLQLSFAELKAQLAQNNTSITTLLAEIKGLDKARENQNLSLKALKWQITTFSAGAASLTAILVETLIKYFLK